MNEYIAKNLGYHFGDLGIKIKSEKRDYRSNRDTGHFGTGFYCLSRCTHGEMCWEINLSKYNLFKPETNSDGHNLHRALEVINKTPDVEILRYDTEGITKDFNYALSDTVEPDNIIDIIMSKEEVSYRDAYKIWVSDDYDLEDYRSIDKEVVRNKLREIIKRYKIYSDDYIDNPIIKFFDEGMLEGLHKQVREFNKDVIEVQDNFTRALYIFSRLFNLPISELRTKALLAIESLPQEDSKSTVFMKSLGYEGIDVTHLSKDNGGYQGLDNRDYGSVVYDLKPGTYKRLGDYAV